MEKKYENLRQKTVFDFCDDPKIIGKVFNNDGKHVLEHSDFWRTVYTRNPIPQALDLFRLSEVTKNKELQEAVEKEFKKELEEYEASFNE